MRALSEFSGSRVYLLCTQHVRVYWSMYNVGALLLRVVSLVLRVTDRLSFSPIYIFVA